MNALAHSVPELAVSARATFKSPGLELLAQRLTAPGKHRILDLGAPNGANVEFFSRFPCILHIEDLLRNMRAWVEPPADGEACDAEALVAQALAHDEALRFDVVLGWDLFGYLDEPMVCAMMRHLAPHFRRGALLFLLVSNREGLPCSPARFTILDEARLSYEPATGPARENPRYSPRALERMMPGFRLLHSFLLGDGMQDYLFVFE